MKQNRNRVGFAIIGTGTVAIRHARAIEEIECAELVAVHDVDQDRARSFALEHNTGAVFHLQDLLANDHIDVVTVATPSGTHGTVAIPAAKAGKHIICEKPLETTLEKADAIIEACEENPEDQEIRRKGEISEGLHSGAGDPKAAGYKGHKQQFQDMARAILEKREPLISGREGRRALELICGIYESARSGQPYRFVK